MRFSLQTTYECYQVVIELLSWIWVLDVWFSEHGPLLSVDRQWTGLGVMFAWFVDCYNIDHTFVLGCYCCVCPSSKFVASLGCDSAMCCSREYLNSFNYKGEACFGWSDRCTCQTVSNLLASLHYPKAWPNGVKSVQNKFRELHLGNINSLHCIFGRTGSSTFGLSVPWADANHFSFPFF